MSKTTALSSGCIEAIMKGDDFDKPIVQILGTKKIAGAEGAERYRMLVSDGKYLNSFAMLATQLNNLYTEGNLAEFTIIQLDRYITSMVNKSEKGDKRVLIILELTVLNHGSQVGMKIGNPVNYTGETSKIMENNNSPKPAVPAAARSNGLSVSSRPPTANTYGASAAHSTLMDQSQSINTSVTHPISSLSPYQHKWVIKARVTSKSSIRTWSNAKGEGKLFNMDLMDESGEIRATAFRDAVDKYYDMIEVDKVYYFSKCQLKPANKQFSTLDNDYEMTFNNDTVVQLCEEEESAIPKIQVNLVPISQIASIEPKASVDVIGVCRESGEVQTFTGKTNNREFKKREVVLVDSSNASVTLTLWGEDAVNFDGLVQPVVLVKGARVTEFGGGKSISVGMGSNMKINPDIPEGHKLRGWFDNGGAESISASVSSRTNAGGSYNTDWVTFHEAQAKNFGGEDKADYFQVKAVIHIVRNTGVVYKACPTADCNKKVIDEENSRYRCEKCNEVFENFKYRLLLSMSIGDWTSNRWVTCFNELGEQILGKTAHEIGEAVDGNTEAAEKIFAPVIFKTLIFKLRAKVEMFGDMNRTKYTALNVSALNYKEYNKHLIKNLQELTGIGKAKN